MRQTVKVTVAYLDDGHPFEDDIKLFLDPEEISQFEKSLQDFAPSNEFTRFCDSYGLSYEAGYYAIKEAKEISL